MSGSASEGELEHEKKYTQCRPGRGYTTASTRAAEGTELLQLSKETAPICSPLWDSTNSGEHAMRVEKSKDNLLR